MSSASPKNSAPDPKIADAYFEPPLVDMRVLKIGGLSVVIGLLMGFVAQWFMHLIYFITNACFYGRFSFHPAAAMHNTLGWRVIFIPILGAVVVGLIARYGAKEVRGHGIPEAMEQVLLNKSRISPKIAILKPLSSAIAIGTGGPFGAEGPIIATGGAIGSFIGQLFEITASERKTLLAAGAAAGLTATFGAPVAAVLLAIELFLFEFKARSVIPVTLASVAATCVRMALLGPNSYPLIPHLVQPGGEAIAFYIGLGVVCGFFSVALTHGLTAIEGLFEKLPIHWMWWPAIGAIAIGVVGWIDPRSLGPGYENIYHILNGDLTLKLLLTLGIYKLISWLISVSSGTSGGTLAPLFTIGGALCGALGMLLIHWLPATGVDPRIAGLVGMAAVFAGASKAFLASAVFSFEVARQPMSLLPLLGGCAASYFISCYLMRHSMMTDKMHRHGVRVPTEYATDYLDQMPVREIASRKVVTVGAGDALEEVSKWMLSGAGSGRHQGFPVVDKQGRLTGVITRRDILEAGDSPRLKVEDVLKRPPVYIYEDCSVRQASDQMARHGIGRLPVVSRQNPGKITGILTRSDLLEAHSRQLEEHSRAERNIRFAFPAKKT